MEKRWGILAVAVVSTFCILFIVGPAFAVTVPEKLKDIPFYQGPTVQQAMDMENHAMLSATVKAKIDAIADFYKSAIPGKGWKMAFQTEQEDMKIIQFQKDKLLLQVTIQFEKGCEAATYNPLMTSHQRKADVSGLPPALPFMSFHFLVSFLDFFSALFSFKLLPGFFFASFLVSWFLVMMFPFVSPAGAGSLDAVTR